MAEKNFSGAIVFSEWHDLAEEREKIKLEKLPPAGSPDNGQIETFSAFFLRFPCD